MQLLIPIRAESLKGLGIVKRKPDGSFWYYVTAEEYLLLRTETMEMYAQRIAWELQMLWGR